jgi:hypothetical protein
MVYFCFPHSLSLSLFCSLSGWLCDQWDVKQTFSSTLSIDQSTATGFVKRERQNIDPGKH